MTAEQLTYYKEKLVTKRKQTIESLEYYGKCNPETGSYEAQYKDIGDDYDENAYEVTTYGRNQAVEETLEETLEKIDRALKRIEEGTYGVCQKTGKRISEERLEVFPEAEECIEVSETATD